MKTIYVLFFLLLIGLAVNAEEKKPPLVSQDQGTEIALTSEISLNIIAEEQAIQITANFAGFIMLTEYDPCAGQPAGQCYCTVEVVVQGDLTQHKKSCYKAEGAPTTWPVHFYTAYWWTATP